MFCMNCGAKLPEQAQFCFACGEKITRTMENNEDQSKKCSEREIVNEFKVGNCTIGFNAEESKEIMIRSIFRKNADISAFFLKTYGHIYVNSFEGLFNEYYKKFSEIIRQNLGVAVKTLMSLGIDTYDKDTIYFKTAKYIDLEKALEQYYEPLREIENKVAEFNLDAQKRKQDKNPWRGGGFGVGGAIKGALLAGVLNVGANFVGNLEDGVINSFDKKTIKKMKTDHFNKDKSQNLLPRILYEFVCKIGEVVYEIMVDEKIAQHNHWWDFNKMIAKRNNIVELYNEGEISEEDILTELCNCYNHYPFAIYVKQDIVRVNSSLFCDVLDLYRMDGSINLAKNYYLNLDRTYSLLYFEINAKKENDLPNLWQGKQVIDKLKNNDYNMMVSKEMTQKVCKILIKALILRKALSEAFLELLGDDVENPKGYHSFDILQDENYFIKPIIEFMIYDFQNLESAVEIVVEFNVCMGKDETDKEAIRMFGEMQKNNIQKTVDETIDNAAWDELMDSMSSLL